MKKAPLMVSALILVSLLIACAPKAALEPGPEAAAREASGGKTAPTVSAPAAPAKPAWQEKWETVLQAAKREGKVSVYSTYGSAARAAITNGLQDAYGIPAETMAGSGSQLAVKVLAERRAGLYIQDINIGGATTMVNVLKPAGVLAPLDSAFILPDLTDPEVIKKVWLNGELNWVDKDHTILNFVGASDPPLAINTNLVKEGEVKSLRDLLNPKWKGKIIMNDPTVAGVGQSALWFANYSHGWAFVEALAKQEPIISRDERLQIDWLTHGKAAIVLGPKGDPLTDFIKAGAPVSGMVPTEGSWTGGKMVNLFTNQAHPNAASILLNWMLSKEGQEAIARADGQQSGREDVPTDFIPAFGKRQAGVKYVAKDKEDILKEMPELSNKAKILFESLMKK